MGKGKLLKLSPSRGPLRIVTFRDTKAFITSNKRHCFTKSHDAQRTAGR